jgi:hypothetical protein
MQSNSNDIYADYPKLPLNAIAEELGYKVKRHKSSNNSIVMTDGRDTIVVSRGKGNGNYLYYNTDGNMNDRGTVFNFCKNRNVNVHDLIQNINFENVKYKISSAPKEYSMHITEKYNQLQSYNKQENVHSLWEKRAIGKEITDKFDAIKVDGYKNIIFPSFTFEVAKVRDSKKGVLTISGMSKKLLEKPLTHDKDGVKYEKPINTLEEGKPGLSILRANGTESFNVKKVILGENSIDNLSYAEIKKIDLSSSLLVSFNGSMKDDAIKAFRELIKILPNLKEVVSTYDNDKQGDIYHDKTLSILSKNKDIEIKRDKSLLKDWNEDLKAYKIVGKGQILEKGGNLKDEISKLLDEKITLYNSYPDVPVDKKSKLFRRIEQLSKWITPNEKQQKSLEKIISYQKSLERENQ